MIHLGDRLGLYTAMRAAGSPVTVDELATATSLDPRWIQEWVHNQAAAKLVEADTPEGGPERFSLSPEAAVVLADPDHPAFGMGMFHRFPQTMQAVVAARESFHTGLGNDYDSHGPEGAVGIERSFEPWNRSVPRARRAPGARRRGRQAGGRGDGRRHRLRRRWGVDHDGQGVPRVDVPRYDISQYALARAEEKKAEAGVDNVHFHDRAVEPLSADGSVDLVTTFDCIHDMTHPQEMMAAIRSAIAADGTWLLVDIKALDTYADNVRKNPMAALMYGISVLSCMSSALSEPGGAGLGTLGLPESKARAMAETAGFTRFQRLKVDHAVNVFYEVRP